MRLILGKKWDHPSKRPEEGVGVDDTDAEEADVQVQSGEEVSDR